MLITPEDIVRADSRWKHWAKHVPATAGNLNAKNGNDLGGDWIGWSKTASIPDGDYIVLAHEEGSRASHSYKYRLFIVSGGERVAIAPSDSGAELANALADGRLTEAQYAASQSNTLAKYAILIGLGYTGEQPADETKPAPVDNADSGVVLI